MKEAIPKKQLERIVETIPDGIIITDKDGVFTYANAAAERITGLSGSQIIGRTCNEAAWKLSTIEGAPFLNENLPYQQALATGKPVYGTELAIERADGLRIILTVSAAPIFDDKGEITNLVITFSDITKRKRAEILLVESEARFRCLVELSPDPVVVHSEGKIVYINSAGLKLVNAKCPNDVFGKPVLSFVHPDYVDVVKERVLRQQRGEAVGLIEEKFMTVDGQAKDVEVTASPITYKGKPSFMVVIRDITERKKAEERVKESERRFRELLEKTTLIAYTLDAGGNVTFANDALLNLTGWRRGEIIGKNWFDTFILPEHRERVRKVFLDSTAQDTIPVVCENKIMTAWGTTRIISCNNVILRGLNGEVIGTASIGEDVTEQKRLFNELNALSQITDVAISTLNLNELLDSLLHRLIEVMGADVAAILLKEGGYLSARASIGIEDDTRHGFSIKIGQGFAGTIAQTAMPLYIADAQTDQRVINPVVKERGIRSMLGVPMMRDGNLIGVLHIGWLRIRKKSDSLLHLLKVAADRCAMAITNAQLHEKTKESGRLIGALNNINTVINSTLDFDEIVQRVIIEATNAIGCETAAIDLREGNHWVVKYFYGSSKEMIGVRFTDEEFALSAIVAKTKRPIVINDTQSDERVNREIVDKYNIKSLMVVPLIIRENVVGVLFFSYHSTMVSFSEAQIDFAGKLGAAVSLALDNARFYTAERNIADSLRDILIKVPQEIPGINIGHLYHPAIEEDRPSRDFYDLFELDHGRVGIIVGSVSGKGIEAAASITVVKNTIRAHAFEDYTPAQIIAKTNDTLLKTSRSSSFATVFFGVLETDTGKLTYCSAGHPPAIIKRETSDVEVLTRHSPSMGTLSRLHYKNGKGTLKKSDTLVVYTDGVIEAGHNGKKGKFLDEEKLVGFIKDLSPVPASEVPQKLYDHIMECVSDKLVDDVAIVAISLSDVIQHS